MHLLVLPVTPSLHLPLARYSEQEGHLGEGGNGALGKTINALLWCDRPGGHAGEDGRRGKTWKTVDELTDEEKAVLDLRTDTPRDPHLPYLPQERFPVTPLYTAEEMGLQAMEFLHTPFWIGLPT